MPGPGVVIIAEAYYPAWQATVQALRHLEFFNPDTARGEVADVTALDLDQAITCHAGTGVNTKNDSHIEVVVSCG